MSVHRLQRVAAGHRSRQAIEHQANVSNYIKKSQLLAPMTATMMLTTDLRCMMVVPLNAEEHVCRVWMHDDPFYKGPH